MPTMFEELRSMNYRRKLLGTKFWLENAWENKNIRCRLGIHGKKVHKFGGWVICERCGKKLGEWY